MKNLDVFDKSTEDDRKLLYHGSGLVVERPVMREVRYFKDFGYGFYTTCMQNQANKWANRFKQPTVSIYSLDTLYSTKLNNKVFEDMTEDWLDFIVFCRTGGKHNYDTVEGPMADDTIFNFVNDFISKKISRTAFWELCKFKHPTHQLVFNTKISLDYLSYGGFYNVQRRIL